MPRGERNVLYVLLWIKCEIRILTIIEASALKNPSLLFNANPAKKI